MRFVPNRNAPRDLARSLDMQRFLGHVAGEAANEAQRRAPNVQGDKIRVEAVSDATEAAVVVHSSMWHLPEFGRGDFPPRPYLRPGVQTTIERFGGRWKSS